MNNEPRPIAAIAVNADVDRHLVLVKLGNQTLALAPEAAHALALALTKAASALCPIADERPKIGPPVTAEADLLINTIAVLVDRYRQGTLQPPPVPDSKLVPKTLPAVHTTVVTDVASATISDPTE